jgi:GntR family transcriptional regulator
MEVSLALELRVTPGSPTPIYRQIVDQIRHGVAGGMRLTGDALPSIRGLAEQLVVNPNTVAKAYSELVRDGVIESRQGRGYFVADRRQVYSDAERNRRLEGSLQSFLSEALVLNFTADEIRSAIDRGLGSIQAKGVRRGKSNE